MFLTWQQTRKEKGVEKNAGPQYSEEEAGQAGPRGRNPDHQEKGETEETGSCWPKASAQEVEAVQGSPLSMTPQQRRRKDSTRRADSPATLQEECGSSRGVTVYGLGVGARKREELLNKRVI